MPRDRRPSSQTVRLLTALSAEPLEWRYGYELGLEVGLQSGSLYPILLRLADRELLDSKWEEAPPRGRPPRHLYRLSTRGREYAAAHGQEDASGEARPRIAERAIGALFILGLLVLLTTYGLPAAVRASRPAAQDRPVRLLEVARHVLPPTRSEWGEAMGGELAQIVGARARWRFSVGCVWAALVIRSRSREPGGEALRIVVLAGIAFALALGGYGVLRYPGLRHGYHLWSSLAVFVIVLALYAAVTLMLSRGTDRHATHARNYGLAGGLGVGLAWLAVLSPTPAFKSFVIVPLTVVLLGPALRCRVRRAAPATVRPARSQGCGQRSSADYSSSQSG